MHLYLCINDTTTSAYVLEANNIHHALEALHERGHCPNPNDKDASFTAWHIRQTAGMTIYGTPFIKGVYMVMEHGASDAPHNP